MAVRFARQAGNWSDPLTWDGGLTIPTTGDDVFSNGYNVTIDQDINVASLTNSITVLGMPLSPIPNMTSNTTPSGEAFASQNNSSAWLAFKKGLLDFNTSLYWQGTVSVQIGYRFDVARSIQRYSFYAGVGTSQRPRDWTFQGSNDGISWTTLHTVTSAASSITYFSPNIANPSTYTYYRLNFTAVQSGTNIIINYIDMTESTDTVANGYGTNGRFISNNNRTITLTDLGLYRTAGGTQLCLLIGGSSTTTNIIGNIAQYVIGNSTMDGILYMGGASNTVNVTGDVFVSTLATNLYRTVVTNASSNNILNIVGNAYSYSNQTTATANCIFTIAQGTINIIGNVIHYGIGGQPDNNVIYWLGGTANITGTLIGSTGPAKCVSASILRLSGTVLCQNGYFPLNAVSQLQLSDSNPTTIRFQTTTNANKFMYTAGVALGNPAITDVRNGITYGPNSELTGTSIMPSASTVTLGVVFDNGTIGTAQNTSASFLAELTASTDPLAERLRNVSTVDSTAATVAAYNV